MMDCGHTEGEAQFGGPGAVAKLFPGENHQVTHNKLFGHNRMHIDNLGGWNACTFEEV